MSTLHSQAFGRSTHTLIPSGTPPSRRRRHLLPVLIHQYHLGPAASLRHTSHSHRLAPPPDIPMNHDPVRVPVSRLAGDCSTHSPSRIDCVVWGRSCAKDLPVSAHCRAGGLTKDRFAQPRQWPRRVLGVRGSGSFGDCNSHSSGKGVGACGSGCNRAELFFRSTLGRQAIGSSMGTVRWAEGRRGAGKIGLMWRDPFVALRSLWSKRSWRGDGQVINERFGPSKHPRQTEQESHLGEENVGPVDPKKLAFGDNMGSRAFASRLTLKLKSPVFGQHLHLVSLSQKMTVRYMGITSIISIDFAQ
ncbi:hypothetical protein C8R43DRAFT_959247 [Mycena crocata]|nr:hypothetical protein C8R43DRAFT_959247 [Mycena crocata]